MLNSLKHADEEVCIENAATGSSSVCYCCNQLIISVTFNSVITFNMPTAV